MKTFSLVAIALLAVIVAQAQDPRPQFPPVPSRIPPASMAPVKEPANYLVRVEWKDPKGDSKFLEVLTAEGHFNLDTIQKNSVMIDSNTVPAALKFNGTLNVINDEKGRLQLFLGRTVPYVTHSSSTSSTYSQMQVGLESTFIVTFGKPLVIQNDENTEISVLVKRAED